MKPRGGAAQNGWIVNLALTALSPLAATLRLELGVRRYYGAPPLSFPNLFRERLTLPGVNADARRARGERGGGRLGRFALALRRVVIDVAG